MKLFIYICLTLLASSYANELSEYNSGDIEAAQKTLDKLSQLTLVQIKSRISDRIDTKVNAGLAKLAGIHEKCAVQAVGSLEQTRNDSKKLLNECSAVIPATVEDIKGIIKVGFMQSMWILGSVWDMVAAYGPCLHPSEHDDTLYNCIFTATQHVFGLIEDDAILVVKYSLWVAGFVFKTILRVYACIDEELIAASIESTVTQAQQCHQLFNNDF